MNLETIYDNIMQSSRLEETYSLPLYISGMNRVYWFNYLLKHGEASCRLVSLYSCDLNGEDIKEYDYSFEDAIDFDDPINPIDEDEYDEQLPNVKTKEELIELIRRTDEITFTPLYKRVIEVMEKEN